MSFSSTVFTVLGRLIARLPARPVVALAGGLGSLVSRLPLQRCRVVRENIATAFGDSMAPAEQRRVAAAAWSNLFMMAAESCYLAFAPTSWLESAVVEVEGREVMEHFLKDPFVLSVAAHMGNWEVMGAWIAHRQPFGGFAKTLHDPHWHRMTEAMRMRHGITLFYADKPIARQALAWLKARKPLNILADQDFGVQGLFVPFFGIPASTNPAPALFAIRTGCPILPVTSVRLGPARHRVRFCQPIDPADFPADTEEERIAAIMARVNSIYEDWIRENPGQYFWFHRRWKTTPTAAAKRLETLARRRRERRGLAGAEPSCCPPADPDSANGAPPA